MKDSFYFIGGSAAAKVIEKSYSLDGSCVIKPAEGGKVYTDGELSLVFKGCIYSYADPCLPCDSDEEYVIAAYRSHGENMFNAFEGKFSLYLFDSEKNCAYFARDHFGGMPLYYSFGPGYAMASDKPSPLANCGLVEENVLTAKGHVYDESADTVTITAATCTAEGTKTQLCSVCKDPESAITETIAKIDHNWVGPTCYENAYCSMCYTRGAAQLEHDFEYYGYKCSICGYILALGQGSPEWEY